MVGLFSPRPPARGPRFARGRAGLRKPGRVDIRADSPGSRVCPALREGASLSAARAARLPSRTCASRGCCRRFPSWGGRRVCLECRGWSSDPVATVHSAVVTSVGHN
eukprot:5952092-Pyramimonas_sp.AAC.1